VLPILGAKTAEKGSGIASNAAAGLKNDLYVRKWTTVTGKGKDRKLVDHELHINPVGVALGAAATALAAGAAAFMALGGLRLAGKQAVLGERTARFMIDEFEAEYHTVTETVVDQEAYQNWREVPGPITPGYWREGAVIGWRCMTDGAYLAVADWNEQWFASHKDHDVVQVFDQIWVEPVQTTIVEWYTVPAVTHTVDHKVYDAPNLSVLMTKRGIPTGIFQDARSTEYAVNQAMKRAYKAKPGSLVMVRTQRVRVTHPRTRKQVYASRYFYEYKATGIGIEDKKDTDVWWNPFD